MRLHGFFVFRVSAKSSNNDSLESELRKQITVFFEGCQTSLCKVVMKITPDFIQELQGSINNIGANTITTDNGNCGFAHYTFL